VRTRLAEACLARKGRLGGEGGREVFRLLAYELRRTRDRAPAPRRTRHARLEFLAAAEADLVREALEVLEDALELERGDGPREELREEARGWLEDVVASEAEPSLLEAAREALDRLGPSR
jgi:hypothetical protein